LLLPANWRWEGRTPRAAVLQIPAKEKAPAASLVRTTMATPPCRETPAEMAAGYLLVRGAGQTALRALRAAMLRGQLAPRAVDRHLRQAATPRREVVWHNSAAQAARQIRWAAACRRCRLTWVSSRARSRTTRGWINHHRNLSSGTHRAGRRKFAGTIGHCRICTTRRWVCSGRFAWNATQIG